MLSAIMMELEREKVFAFNALKITINININ
jgi:hypothetical protein